MTRPLLPNKKVWKNSKGVSGIIAAIFLVLIVFFLYANVFTFILIQNTSYQEVLSEVNQRDVDRSSERITVSNVNYTVVGDQVRVEAQVKNDGPVSVQIVTLWVTDTTTQKYGYNDTLNINMKTGDTFVFTGSNALTVTIKDSNPSDVFTSWFVTDRGNLIPLEKEKGIIVAQLAQGIGYLSMDFGSFRYFEYETSTKLKNYPDGIVSFDVPKDKSTAFGCNLTNLDPLERTIAIDSHSLLWVIIPTSDVPHSTWWYIVNVAPDGTISPNYSTISIPYRNAKLLVFASANDLGTSGFARQNTPKSVCTVPVFLILHGTIGGTPYGQNLPFVSLYFS